MPAHDDAPDDYFEIDYRDGRLRMCFREERGPHTSMRSELVKHDCPESEVERVYDLFRAFCLDMRRAAGWE